MGRKKNVIVYAIPKDDDYILGEKIVYSEEYVEREFNVKTQSELKNRIWQDIKKIIITTEALVKTSTNKVKRNDEIKKCIEALNN